LITTKIRQNRIIIFIMNLWANRMRQLVFLPVALFFFSCEEEASVLGYKNPNPKFEVSYVEIPLESSVLLLDSQRTSNFVFPNETNRLLIGQYTDDQFGSVVANGYSQFFTTSTSALPAGAVYDSVSLTLRLDLYNYGTRNVSTAQSISVYELDDSLQYSKRRYYFNSSQIPVKPTKLGVKEFTIDADSLDYYAANEEDTVVQLMVPLDAAFGQRLFDEAVDYTGGSDNTFVTYSLFTKLFKGLAIKSDYGDKVLGISTSSFLTVHYHTPTTDSLGLQLGLFGLANFSQITADRSATDLAGLTQFSQDFNPPSDLRYLQSGTGIYTKLDFSKFFAFCDTVKNVVISSAQITVDNVQASSYAPPPRLVVNILNGDTNYKEKYSRANTQDNNDLVLYNPPFPAHTRSLLYETLSGVIINEPDSAFYIEGDSSPEMDYSNTSKAYAGSYTLFFQQLAVPADDKRRFQYYVLTPSSPGSPNTKSLNRAVFPKTSIKLKIHYTKPTTPLN
jgi:hypothetical protein